MEVYQFAVQAVEFVGAVAVVAVVGALINEAARIVFGVALPTFALAFCVVGFGALGFGLAYSYFEQKDTAKTVGTVVSLLAAIGLGLGIMLALYSAALFIADVFVIDLGDYYLTEA